jgi:protocatechuate 3,4-dioxygenase beta subunit
VGTTTTDGAGAYQFDPVAAGTYRINIRNVSVSATTTVAGNLQVQGSASVGNPVRLINVATGATLSATTDANGNFSFAGVAAGTYRINIRKVIIP